MQGIGSCLDELRGLKVLNLCGNSFSAEGCRYITPQLKISTALTLLELSKNYIGDDGAEAIAQILVHHKSLQVFLLDLAFVERSKISFSYILVPDIGIMFDW